MEIEAVEVWTIFREKVQDISQWPFGNTNNSNGKSTMNEAMKMYLLLEMVVFQPAMLVYQRVLGIEAAFEAAKLFLY